MVDLLLVANTDWYLYNFRLSLARECSSRGYQVSLVSPAGPFVQGIRQAGFRWLEWPVGRQSMDPAGEGAALWRLSQVYRAEKPRLVHHFTVKPVLYGSLAARLAGVPAVVNSITGLGYLFIRNTRPVRLLRGLVIQLYRLAFQHANLAVIYENTNDRDYFIARRMVRPQQTSIIRGVGIDLEKYTFSDAPAGQPPLVVLAARMLWDKGVGTLVEAARLLKQGGRPVRVALVGATDPGNPANIPESTLKGWVDAGWVEWWGFHSDMPAVYRQAAVVTLPSVGEGMPTALLEASACGRPIVATDVPGCREVVLDGQTGLLVPPGDAPALAAALQTLLADADLRQRMGAAGRQRMQALFSDQIINRETLAVYAAVLKEVKK